MKSMQWGLLLAKKTAASEWNASECNILSRKWNICALCSISLFTQYPQKMTPNCFTKPRLLNTNIHCSELLTEGTQVAFWWSSLLGRSMEDVFEISSSHLFIKPVHPQVHIGSTVYLKNCYLLYRNLCRLLVRSFYFSERVYLTSRTSDIWVSMWEIFFWYKYFNEASSAL